MLVFHAAGEWRQSQVSLSWGQDSRQRIDEVERLIERTWEKAIAQAGVKLFDGPMCRMESWRATPQRLELVLSRTSYRIFFGTNMRHPQLADQYGPSILANPVGVSPALLSSDGYLLLGRRNAAVAYYPNRLHPFAGALEPAEGLDVFDEVRRELAEELSLTADDIADIRCTGIAEDLALRQPELIFAVRSTRTRAQIESNVDAREHVASIAIPASQQDIDQALVHPDEFTPVAIASMLLWGRTELGAQWFASHRARFGS